MTNLDGKSISKPIGLAIVIVMATLLTFLTPLSVSTTSAHASTSEPSLIGRMEVRSGIALGSTFYFVGNDPLDSPDKGWDLWKSDGSTMTLVRDFRPGASAYDSQLDSLTVLGETLYFLANDDGIDSDLWMHNSAAATTTLVRYQNTQDLSRTPAYLYVLGNSLYFQAKYLDDTTDSELWRLSEGGSAFPIEIRPGTDGSDPKNFAGIGSTLYFSAAGDQGAELWKSDGVTATLVKDINNTFNNSSNPENMAVLGSRIYFNANDGVHGGELWTSDGTSSGTLLLKDIRAGVNDSDPFNLYAHRSSLYFQGSDSPSGREPWISDGTTGGTMVLKDINPGGSSSDPESFTSVGETLFFSATNTSGRELWKSQGTGASTTIVKDFMPSGGSSNPTSLTAFDNKLYFATDHPDFGNELWRTDGTEANTQLVKDLVPGVNGSSPESLVVVGNTLYFNASPDGNHGLYKITISSGSSGGSNSGGSSSDLQSAPVAPLVVESRTSLEVSFVGGSKRLSKSARDAIRKKIKSFETVKSVVCTAKTRLNPSTAERQSALSRAQRACQLAKKVSPDTTAQIRSRVSETRGSESRRVQIVTTGTKKK